MTVQMQMAFEVNGIARRIVVEPRDTLVDVLRDKLSLTGTPKGCEEGATLLSVVLVDGEPVNAETMFAVQAHGRTVTTIEGLSADGLSSLQAALVADGVAGSGVDLPGLVMLLEGARGRGADAMDSLEQLMGCAGYSHSAVRQALAFLRKDAGDGTAVAQADEQ
ncbi:MAG: (2Fe-2S)-binding protein [Pseudomonadota bacterium]